MIIRSIHLKEGVYNRSIDFSPSVNLIYSIENGQGKTTLLRFLLYGLGYAIPNTRHIKFEKCEVTLNIESENLGKATLQRNDGVSITLSTERSQHLFFLPDQVNSLHEMIFGTSNADILNNLLGTFYLDQEKGWTLLNRGTVIGSVRFNIEELVRGLANKDVSQLQTKLRHKETDKMRYNMMLSVANYRTGITGDYSPSSPTPENQEKDATILDLQIEEKQLLTDLRRIDRIQADNRRFKKYIADLKLIVEAPDGAQIPITGDNIIGMNDSIELLAAKRSMVSKQLKNVKAMIERITKGQEDEFEQLEFFHTASSLEIFDQNISQMSLNERSIKKQINQLEKEIKQLRGRISSCTYDDNDAVGEMSNFIQVYMKELGLEESNPSKYLFTSNLKELTGAILHKTVFAFRLAYIKTIEKRLEIKLPIILDSPTGKEIDRPNINLMMDILKRDFSDNQIIIASIYKYDFENLNVLEIKDRLITELQ